MCTVDILVSLVSLEFESSCDPIFSQGRVRVDILLSPGEGYG